MSFYGADVDALDALGLKMAGAADQLEGIQLAVRSLLYTVPWTGDDAEGFRSDWDGVHTARIKAAVELLRTGADALKRNAAEQRQASDPLAAAAAAGMAAGAAAGAAAGVAGGGG